MKSFVAAFFALLSSSFSFAEEPLVLTVPFVAENLPSRPLRVVLAGDSITWGGGLLDDSFVAAADRTLRLQLAQTVLPPGIKSNGGELKRLKNPKFFGGEAVVLEGVGASCSFELFGDELSLCIARERGSQVAVPEVEVFADGASLGTFDTANHEPAGEEAKTFVGDGQTVKFDLGRCFTYGHQVEVGGKVVQGKLNTAGYGGRFAKGNDYMVIRKYFRETAEGKPSVHHVLWFREAPVADAPIQVKFSYGENILYARTTVTESGEAIDSPLESRYGDGRVNFDPARPSSISSGLDFRMSDQRSVVTFPLQGCKKRKFVLVVKAKANEAGQNPRLILNFATNRFHHIMNAGIGGWRAGSFLRDSGLRSWKEAMDFEPDILFLGMGTNDDWNGRNQFIAYRTVKGMPEEELRGLSTIWIRDFKPGATGFDVNLSMLKIAAVTPNSVRLEQENLHFEQEPIPGDVLIMGDYHGDNRTVRCRELTRWDATTATAHFDVPLQAGEFQGLKDLNELCGQDIRIKRTPEFIESMRACIEAMRKQNPKLVLGLEDTGYSNYRTRVLFGYPLRIRRLAGETRSHHVDFYNPLEKWIFSQPTDFPVQLDKPMKYGESGVAYRLADAKWKDLFESIRFRRQFSVKVNGVERFGDGCRVEGGISFLFKPELDLTKVEMKPWNNRPRSLTRYGYPKTLLVFTERPPRPGDKIEVSCSRDKWSGDDCHLASSGASVCGKVVGETLLKMVKPAGK